MDSTERFAGIFEEMAQDEARNATAAPAPKMVGFTLPPPVKAAMVATAAVVTAPAPKATLQPLTNPDEERTNTNGPVDVEGRARAIASAAVADKHGLIAREATLFTWGTQGQWGDAAYKARTELRARPLLSAFASEVKAQVAAELRRTDAVALPACTYGEDDKLRTKAGSAGAPMTAHSFRQLLNRAQAPGYAAGYLGHAEMPVELRAPHVQHWLDRAVEADKKGKDGKEQPIKAVLLSKLAGDKGRHVYGVVSDSYTRYDLDKVIGDVLNACPSTARGSLKYDATTTKWSMDITIGAEFEPVVGDIHRVVLRVSGHDAGGGSISVRLFAERVRCLNFSKVHLSSKVKGRIRHMGDNVGGQVRALLGVQAEALKEFAEVWREANEEGIIADVEKREGGDIRAIFRALIAAGRVDAPEGEDIAVERFFNAWMKEPASYTRAAVVNAITRAAHESPWSNPWAMEQLEDQASELLYNRVVLAPDAIAA